MELSSRLGPASSLRHAPRLHFAPRRRRHPGHWHAFRRTSSRSHRARRRRLPLSSMKLVLALLATFGSESTAAPRQPTNSPRRPVLIRPVTSSYWLKFQLQTMLHSLVMKPVATYVHLTYGRLPEHVRE